MFASPSLLSLLPQPSYLHNNPAKPARLRERDFARGLSGDLILGFPLAGAGAGAGILLSGGKKTSQCLSVSSQPPAIPCRGQLPLARASGTWPIAALPWPGCLRPCLAGSGVPMKAIRWVQFVCKALPKSCWRRTVASMTMGRGQLMLSFHPHFVCINCQYGDVLGQNTPAPVAPPRVVAPTLWLLAGLPFDLVARFTPSCPLKWSRGVCPSREGADMSS